MVKNAIRIIFDVQKCWRFYFQKYPDKDNKWKTSSIFYRKTFARENRGKVLIVTEEKLKNLNFVYLAMTTSDKTLEDLVSLEKPKAMTRVVGFCRNK